MNKIYYIDYLYSFLDFLDIMNILVLSKKLNKFIISSVFIKKLIKKNINIQFENSEDMIILRCNKDNPDYDVISIRIYSKNICSWCFNCNQYYCKDPEFHSRFSIGYQEILRFRHYKNENKFNNIVKMKLIYYKLKEDLDKISEMNFPTFIKYMSQLYISYINKLNLSISCKNKIQEYLEDYNLTNSRSYNMKLIKYNYNLFFDIFATIINYEDIEPIIYFHFFKNIYNYCI